MNKILLAIGIFLLLISCDQYSPRIREALELSGNNRQQLEKVLQHYSSPNDSLKLQAAIFLIENMPGHYTLRGEKIDRIREIIDRDTVCSYYYKKLYDIILGHFVTEDKNVILEEDVEHVTTDFLIRHIDATFELANKQKLLDMIPFNLFLEHLLPYRFEHERLDLWRDSMLVTVTNVVCSSFPGTFFPLKAASYLNDSRIHNQRLIFNLVKQDPFKDCYFITYNDLFLNRAMGIPQIMDCIPFYSNRNGYHYWRADMPLISKELIVTGALDRRSAKIYRSTFSRNSTLKPDKSEFIPELFLNPFKRDVTDSYYYTTDIHVSNNTTSSPHHAYLCVFNDLQWKPIAAGKVIRGEAVFKRLVKNIVYLPVYYTSSGEAIPFNFPFILDTRRKIKYLVPDKSSEISLHLERKNSDLSGNLPEFMRSLNGCVVEASNDEKFSRTDVVFLLSESERLFYECENIQPEKEYRWYRIKNKNRKYLAELYFLDSNGEFMQGKVDSSKHAIIDGNPLTSVTLQEDLIIHFDAPVKINKLICLPRNDGNGIYPGNIYELFYFGKEGWQSVGTHEGSKFHVEYEHVPGNALYWLRNLTTGVEERIFTYNGNNVIFW